MLDRCIICSLRYVGMLSYEVTKFELKSIYQSSAGIVEGCVYTYIHDVYLCVHLCMHAALYVDPILTLIVYLKANFFLCYYIVVTYL